VQNDCLDSQSDKCRWFLLFYCCSSFVWNKVELIMIRPTTVMVAVFSWRVDSFVWMSRLYLAQLLDRCCKIVSWMNFNWAWYNSDLRKLVTGVYNRTCRTLQMFYILSFPSYAAEAIRPGGSRLVYFLPPWTAPISGPPTFEPHFTHYTYVLH